MMRCDHCRNLLLDHLYGLLDDPDAAAVEEHLSACPGCAAAREQEARVQGLIARAARVGFPQVRFAPPTTDPASGNGPAAVPTTPTPAHRGGWARWVLAASVLILIPGVLVPVQRSAQRLDAARAGVADAGARYADARRELDHVRAEPARKIAAAEEGFARTKQEHDRLLAEWVAAEKAALQATQDRKLRVEVHRPATVQPGAANDLTLIVQDQGPRPTARRVEAEVRDQTDAVLFRQEIDYERQPAHRLRLPAGLWARVKPDSELFLVVSTVDPKTGARTELVDPVRLFGPVYATLLVTDRPTYRPGERVYFRSLTLDRVTFRPPDREQFLVYSFRGAAVSGTTGLVRVRDGRVEAVTGPDGKPIRGVGTGSFDLPADLADGDYTLTLTELPRAGYPPVVQTPVTRVVRVRAGRPERFAKQLGFAAAAFAPGSAIEAWCELKFQDKPVAGARVEAVATADGWVVLVNAPAGRLPKAPPTVTGPDGRATLRFTLPDDLPRGDVRLKVTFHPADGSKPESVAERVPVAGRQLVVEFFPEGGTLVAGVPNRVYVRATTPAGRPADLRGFVTDGNRIVARVETLTDKDQPGANRGLGSFTFTPEPDTAYRLTVEDPAGVAAPDGGPGLAGAVAARLGFRLPGAEAGGVVMTVADPVTAPGEPVRVRVYSPDRPRNLVVGAYTRGRLADTQRATAGPGEPADVQLMANADPRGGVTRITVFEDPNAEDASPKADLIPRAERLVFRKPGEKLNLAFRATSGGSPVIAPSGPVELTISGTDERGNPAPAVVWVAAVNSAVAPGPTDRLLPTHFLIAGEIESPDAMEYADFLLTDHPKAAPALDLVLATQGWRRFAEQARDAPVRRPPARPEDLNRLRAINGQELTGVEDPLAREHRRLTAEFWPRYEAATRELEDAERVKAAAVRDRSWERAFREKQAAVDALSREVREKAREVEAAAGALRALRGWAWVAVGGLALVAIGLGVAAAASQRLPVATGRLSAAGRVVPLAVGAAGAIGLALFLILSARPTPAEPAEVAEVPDAAVEPPMAPGGDAKQDRPPDAKAGLPEKADPPPRPGKAPAPPMPPVSPAGPDAPGVMAMKADPPGKAEPGGPAATGPGMKAFGPLSLPKGGSPPSIPQPGVVRTQAGPGAPLLPGRQLIPDEELLKDVRDAVTKTIRPRPAEAEQARRDAEAVLKFAADRASSITGLIDAVLGRPEAAGPEAFAPDRAADTLAAQRVRSVVPQVPPLVVREYAAPRPADPEDDSPDTVLWQPVLILPADGRATITFHAGNAPGGYQVTVAGHTPDGRIGAVRGVVPVAPPAKPPADPLK